MRNITRFALSVATLAALTFVAAKASAVPLTLTIDPSVSSLTLDGQLSGFTFLEQAAGSKTTSYTGTITVDVDNPLAPTTISILSGVIDANVNGSWLPKLGGSTGDTDADPTPPAEGDYGLKAQLFNQDAAFAAARGLVFDISSGPEAVVGGMFNSTESLAVVSGVFDSWVTPVVGGGGGNDDLTGDLYLRDATLPTQSSYVISGKTATLTIPIRAKLVDDDDFTAFSGTLVATATIPEPSTLMLLGTVVMGAMVVRRRK